MGYSALSARPPLRQALQAMLDAGDSINKFIQSGVDVTMHLISERVSDVGNGSGKPSV